MRLRRIFAVAIITLIQACVISQSRKIEADETARAAYGQCDALRKAGSLRTHVAAVECAIPKVVAAYNGAAYPFEDLIYFDIVARRIGANNIDIGDKSEAEVQRDITQLESRIAAEERRRNDVINRGGNPKPVSADVLLQGLNALMPAPTAAALPPLRSGAPPNCFALGTTRRCE